MLNDLKQYLKKLYTHRKIDASRYRELLMAAETIRNAGGRADSYDLLIELATEKGFGEFKKFLTQNRLRAAEEMENTFIEKVDDLINRKEIEKAALMLQMMRSLY